MWRKSIKRRLLSAVSTTAGVAVVATSLVTGSGPAAAANWKCQGAEQTPGANQHCWAITYWGSHNGPQGAISFSEVGADMEVDCLSLGFLTENFINYEMWMYTNTHYSHNVDTWVEQGYTRGDSAQLGLPTLTPWHFWADSRNPNFLDYAEHYISNAPLGQYIDKGFKWIPNTNNWMVFNNHVQVGTSVNVGAWAGGLQMGLEFTDRQVAAVGNARNVRYKTGVNGTFVPAPIGGAYSLPTGAGTATSTGSTQHANTPNNCSYPAAAAPTPQAEIPSPRAIDPTQAVTEVAPQFAKSFGDTTPTSSKAVTTTRAAANKLQDTDIKGNETVTMLEMTGEFDAQDRISGPYGAKIPNRKGSTLTAVIDQATGQLLDWRLSNKAPSTLASLGQVVEK